MGNLNSRNKVTPLESALREIIEMKNGTIAGQGATILSKNEAIARQKKEIEDVECKLRAAEARAEQAESKWDTAAARCGQLADVLAQIRVDMKKMKA
jgi:uncharacterized coiled-coil protein SlyX